MTRHRTNKKPPGQNLATKPLEWTLRLPQTKFQAYHSAEVESRFTTNTSTRLYKWQWEARADAPIFVLHDGPPYCSGALHIGHALNKTLKDIVCRYRLLCGDRISFVPGFDCHGLPIEAKALQALKVKNRAEVPVNDLRQHCRQWAKTCLAQQDGQFRRWGIMADWDNPYMTMGAFHIIYLAGCS